MALGDLHYLVRDNYQESITQWVKEAEVVSLPLNPSVYGRGTTPLVVPYKREDYRSVANQLNLMPTVRGHHSHATILHMKGQVLAGDP